MKPVFILPILAVLGFGWGVLTPQYPADYHYSYFSQKAFFEAAYVRFEPTVADNSVEGILVNHHLLAKDLIAEMFSAAANHQPKTVVLLSPNHFGVGKGDVIVSQLPWQTPYGLLPPASRTIDALERSGMVNVDEAPFDGEHGVSGIVAFIRRSLPNSRIVPLILSQRMKRGVADKLAVEMIHGLPQDALIVASVDMSHYMAEDVSAAKDARTILAIQNLDYDAIWDAEIDSPASVYVAMKVMEARNKKFVLGRRDSSALRTGITDPTQNTSYITGGWR